MTLERAVVVTGVVSMVTVLVVVLAGVVTATGPTGKLYHLYIKIIPPLQYFFYSTESNSTATKRIV